MNKRRVITWGELESHFKKLPNQGNLSDVYRWINANKKALRYGDTYLPVKDLWVNLQFYGVYDKKTWDIVESAVAGYNAIID